MGQIKNIKLHIVTDIKVQQLMMFEEIASVDVNCQAQDLFKSFENISLKPNFMNKLVLASENKGFCSISKSQCPLCLIQQCYELGDIFLNSNHETNSDADEHDTPSKKTKLNDDTIGSFRTSCTTCNEKTLKRLSSIINSWCRNSVAEEFTF